MPVGRKTMRDTAQKSRHHHAGIRELQPGDVSGQNHVINSSSSGGEDEDEMGQVAVLQDASSESAPLSNLSPQDLEFNDLHSKSGASNANAFDKQTFGNYGEEDDEDDEGYNLASTIEKQKQQLQQQEEEGGPGGDSTNAAIVGKKPTIAFEQLVSEDDNDDLDKLPNVDARKPTLSVVDDDSSDYDDAHHKQKFFAASRQSLAKANDIFGVSESESEESTQESDYGSDVVADDEDEAVEDGHLFAKPSLKPVPKRVAGQRVADSYTLEEQEKNFLTARQQVIALKDVPERFLTRTIPVTVPKSVAELDQEAIWIFNNAFNVKPLSKATKQNDYGHEVVPKIRNTLDLIRNQFLDIPFIVTYRAEFVIPELNIRDIWTIFDWDAKWMDLQNRKEVLRNTCSYIQDHQYRLSRAINAEEASNESLNLRIIPDAFLQEIDNISTFDQVESLSNYLMFYYGHIVNTKANTQTDVDDQVLNTQQHKLPKYRTFYSICEDGSITQLIHHFGLTPIQLAENLNEKFMVNDIQQSNTELLTLASGFVSEKFPTPNRVVECALNLMAMEIAVEPKIIDYVMEIFKKTGLVTVEPTKRGMSEIDENHSCFPMKFIKEKPLREFKGTEFFELSIEEKNGLLRVRIDIESEEMSNSESSFFKQALGYYQKDEYSLVAQSWNKHREVVLTNAMHRIIFPKIVLTLKRKLLQESQNAAIDRYSNSIGSIINRSPYVLVSSGISEQNIDINQNASQSTRTTQAAASNVEDDMWSENNNDTMNTTTQSIENSSMGSSKIATENESVMTKSAILKKMDPIPRIFSFAYSTENLSKAAVVTVVNSKGVFIDYLVLPNFQYTRHSSKQKIQLKGEDVIRLKEFFKLHEPRAVVIGAMSSKAKSFYQEFRVILERMSDEFEQARDIEVHYCDTRIAKLYQNSKMSEQEFRNVPQLARFAISLGRYFLDPIYELCRLFDPNDVKCSLMHLSLHPLQRELPQEEIHSLIEKMLVTKVNQLGISLLNTYSQAHRRDILKFCCGLGPCKQAMIYRKINMIVTSNRRILSRADIVNELQIGPYIFANCAGFIKFTDINVRRAKKKPHLISFYLDSTRVHPESYHWALKMAQEALTSDGSNIHDADEIFKNLADDSSKVEAINLNTYAAEIQNNGLGDKMRTLTDIKHELASPFADNRQSYHGVSPKELFKMFNHESLQMLSIGKIVIAKVIGFRFSRLNEEDKHDLNPLHNEITSKWMCTFCKEATFEDIEEVFTHVDMNQCRGKLIGVHVLVDQSVSGFIPVNCISDSYDVSKDHLASINPREKVKIGMVLHCRVVDINLKHQELSLSSRSSDLQNTNNRWNHNKDEYHSDEYQQKLEKMLDNTNNGQEEQKMLQRTIIHPKFKNIDYLGAQKLLADKPIGDFIFRPCRGKNDFLTLTWKVAEPNMLANILVEETVKKNASALGEVLMVENHTEKFDDLDEIAASVCSRLAHMAREINQIEDVEEYLDQEKSATPSRVPYIFTMRQEIPGKVMISYMPNRAVNHEYVGLTASGFRFRGRYFNTFNQLIAWFKENFNNPKTVKAIPSVSPASNTPGSSGQLQDANNSADQMSIGSRQSVLSENGITNAPGDAFAPQTVSTTGMDSQNATPFAMPGFVPASHQSIPIGAAASMLPMGSMSSQQELVTPQGTTYNTSMDLSMASSYGMMTPWNMPQHPGVPGQNMLLSTSSGFMSSGASQSSLTPQELYQQALYSQFQNNQFAQMMTPGAPAPNQSRMFDVNSMPGQNPAMGIQAQFPPTNVPNNQNQQ